jgi:hypothetical protein
MAIGDANTFLENDDTDETERNELENQRDLGDLLHFEDAQTGDNGEMNGIFFI